MYPFRYLDNATRKRISAIERRLPGHWSTGELAELLEIGRNAVLMAVRRQLIEPVSKVRGQEHFFTDAEVARYLKDRRSPGRPSAGESNADM